MSTTQDDRLWLWIVSKFVQHDWQAEDVRPLLPGMENLLLNFLNRFSGSARLPSRADKVIHTGNVAHFLFTLQGDDDQFCASVISEGDRHYFQQLESITIDFSNPPPTPCAGAELPSLSEQQLAWMRAEVNMTDQVRLFNHLACTQSRQFALDWFKDGDGFFLAARAWIPYYEPRIAFLWYAAWSEHYLHGNPVLVQNISHNSGSICFTDPLHWRLYRQTGHLKTQISEADYEAMFDAIWQDRARAAGWHLETVRNVQSIELHFSGTLS